MTKNSTTTEDEEEAAISFIIAAAIFAIMDEKESFKDIRRLAEKLKQ